ncbi:hypothetical protein HF086_015177 [Spodoptera exigua]|uniref:Nose resistant-to-fluoxetine protein N-terminal domain-containing protein n=1 Tax=Spodoptera exigua TaxID=7107 RepID=A0A922SJ44_SPOEX|nr:hypothetical protein HF086_015177 [Spodoptera exigua]
MGDRRSVWNANALPTGNLYGSYRHYASYDQCLKPPWLHTHPKLKTQYCFTDFLLSKEDDMKTIADYDPMESTMEYINSPSPSGFPMNHIMWGLCIPAACSPPAVSKLTRVVYEAATFSSIASDVTVKHCQEAGETLPYSTGFYIFMLIGPFALIVFYLISVSKHFSPGPAWIGLEETNVCEKYWVKSLLMMNPDVKHIKNKTIGFVSYAVVAVFSMVIPGVLTYLLQLPGVLFSEYGKYIIRYRETWEFSFIYTAFYSRASTYLVGVAMGYLMHMYKPDDHRNSISKVYDGMGILAMSIGLSYAMWLFVEAPLINITNQLFFNNDGGPTASRETSRSQAGLSWWPTVIGPVHGLTTTVC